jgi:type I restriction enzyme, S subunit
MESEAPLRSLCEVIVDCPHSTPEWTTAGQLVLRSKNIRDGRLDLTEPSFTNRSDFEARIRRAKPQAGDIVITREAPMGECAMVPDGLECCLGQRMVLLRPNREKVDARYLLYALQSPSVQWQIGVHEGTGSTVSNLRIPALEALLIPRPELGEQRAIAWVLGALDDKIELNRQMSRTLDDIAQALFKSWFVDFDAVRAKEQGGSASLPDEIGALFPSSRVASPMGQIPATWTVTQLGSVTENFDSRRVPLSSRERESRRGAYPYYGAAGVIDHVNGFIFDGEYVLVGEDGSVVDRDDRPVVQYVWGQFWVNNHAHVLKGRGEVSDEHLYLFLRRVNIRPFITGAVQPKLNQGNLNRVPFILPQAPVCAAFRAVVKPLFARRRAAMEEAGTLTELRCVLLPRLLSGEIRVAEAESIVAEAV